MKAKTIRQNKYTKDLEALYSKHPQAKEVKERYKVMRIILQREWPSLEKYEQSVLEDILKDAIFLDRKIRKMTEGTDQETKDILEQNYLLNEGYEVGVEKSVSKLKTL